MDLTDLRRTINLCKESINSATQDLTKLTGRSFDKSLDSYKPYSNAMISSRDNPSNNQRFITKRRNFHEEENPNEIKKSRIDKEAPALNSVVQMTKGRTRNDAIHELKTKENPKEKERCKRLFGHLMGTLNSIKKEAEKSTNDPQQLTRLKIEKKVEEDHKIISETIQREQNELIRTKRERQMDLKILNQRYRAADAFERWRIQKEKMKGFIRTSKMPFVFYKPKIINDEAQLRIDQTAREIDTMIEIRKKKLEAEIERVVKKHAEANKHTEGVDIDDGTMENAYHVSSMVGTAEGRRERSRSRVGSFGSEDYDDMIEEIEITMHDDAVHEEEERVVKMEREAKTEVGLKEEKNEGEEIDADERLVEEIEKAMEGEDEEDDLRNVEENERNIEEDERNVEEDEERNRDEEERNIDEEERNIDEEERNMDGEEERNMDGEEERNMDGEEERNMDGEEERNMDVEEERNMYVEERNVVEEVAEGENENDVVEEAENDAAIDSELSPP